MSAAGSGTGSSLPYTDTKPVGAADFYFAINATFQFVLRRLGMKGLRRYWTELGSQYHAPVTELWKQGGAAAIARYWRDFFNAEPGGTADVQEFPDEVRLDVKVCPLIKHLRDNNRAILPCLCQHCYFVSEAMADPAGYTVRISGGNGSCTQRFLKREAGARAQILEDIAEVT